MKQRTPTDAATEALDAAGTAQPGDLTGPLGADVRPIAEPAPTHVDARVVTDCEFGLANSLASVPVDQVAAAVAAGEIDVHPAAVDLARRLAAGEIQL